MSTVSSHPNFFESMKRYVQTNICTHQLVWKLLWFQLSGTITLTTTVIEKSSQLSLLNTSVVPTATNSLTNSVTRLSQPLYFYKSTHSRAYFENNQYECGGLKQDWTCTRQEMGRGTWQREHSLIRGHHNHRKNLVIRSGSSRRVTSFSWRLGQRFCI